MDAFVKLSRTVRRVRISQDALKDGDVVSLCGYWVEKRAAKVFCVREETETDNEDKMCKNPHFHLYLDMEQVEGTVLKDLRLVRFRNPDCLKMTNKLNVRSFDESQKDSYFRYMCKGPQGLSIDEVPNVVFNNIISQDEVDAFHRDYYKVNHKISPKVKVKRTTYWEHIAAEFREYLRTSQKQFLSVKEISIFVHQFYVHNPHPYCELQMERNVRMCISMCNERMAPGYENMLVQRMCDKIISYNQGPYVEVVPDSQDHSDL